MPDISNVLIGITGITDLEEKYTGMVLDMDRFLTTFEPNGSQARDYRCYLAEDEDLDYFLKAYEVDDPRAIDFEADEEGEYEHYEDLPYPNLSLFAEVGIDVNGSQVLSKLTICKVYDTGCFTPGTHSSVLIEAEARRICEVLGSVVRLGPDK